MSHGHAHVGDHGADANSKRIAIFITVIGLFLAIAETLAKGAQTNSIAYNVQSSNLWSFYQAKTIRQTVLKTAAEQFEASSSTVTDAGARTKIDKQIAAWRGDVARYQSEPKDHNMGEGRKELQERALAAEKQRDVYTNKYHAYEISSAAFQIAIVMASVYLLTHVIMLFYAASGLCGLGFMFLMIGMFAPGLFGH